MKTLKTYQTAKHMSNKQIFTLFDPGYKQTFFSSGREIIQGGALRPWEYPEPTPDASRAPKHASKTSKFHKLQLLKNQN